MSPSASTESSRVQTAKDSVSCPYRKPFLPDPYHSWPHAAANSAATKVVSCFGFALGKSGTVSTSVADPLSGDYLPCRNLFISRRHSFEYLAFSAHCLRASNLDFRCESVHYQQFTVLTSPCLGPARDWRGNLVPILGKNWLLAGPCSTSMRGEKHHADQHAIEANPIATAAAGHERQTVVNDPVVAHGTEEPNTVAELKEEEEKNIAEKDYSLSRIPTDRSGSYASIRTGGGEKGGNGVNVQRAEAAFAELSKELSHASNSSQRLAKVQSRQSKKGAIADIEKADESDSSIEPFDLEATLRGGKAEEEAAGIKSKHIGVYWDDLTVSGIGGVKNYVKTFPMAFVSFFNVFETAKNLLGWGRNGRQFDILKNFRGVVKPGEMILVLGRPGSGCTTFLKVMSNQRFGYTSIKGDVLYGPFDSQTFEKTYRGEAVYSDEDDIHHPTLTVGQTLGFALETKVPGKRPAGLSRADFKERIITLLLRMFNIEHTRDTIVGNPFVRGISGECAFRS